jgi:hypothetical protein
MLQYIINQKYSLIGIGDFSHGDQNIWEYRFNLLKDVVDNTDKKILIFNEDSEKHCNNIMNTNKPLHVEEGDYGVYQKKFPYGPLDDYAYRVYDSPIYLKLILYIREHSKRIKMIGVDNEENLARDKEMARRILNKLNKNNINFFYAHNDHVDNRKITQLYETAWHDEKYYCGYYLKNQLGDKYCIILSTGYKGMIRFDGSCSDVKCTKRTPFVYPKFKSFEIQKYEKYENGLYETFDENIAEFTATIFPDNNPFLIKSKTFNCVLFFKKVKPLPTIRKYINLQHFRILDLPAYEEEKEKFTKLNEICEEEDIFEFLKGSKLLAAYKTNKFEELVVFLLYTHTDDYIKIGEQYEISEYQKKYNKLPDEEAMKKIEEFVKKEDHVKRGGIIGKDGYFITSYCGNNIKYKGMGKLIAYFLDNISPEVDYSYLHVDYLDPYRSTAVGVYLKYGFKEIGIYTDDENKLKVMRRMTVYYHGTSVNLDVGQTLKPKESPILNNEKAVFASNRRMVSLIFIPRWSDSDIDFGYYGDIKYNDFYLQEKYEGAFEEIFKGVSGYIYNLDPKNIHSDKRLGMKEVEFISKKPVKILKKEYIKDVWYALQQYKNVLTFVYYKKSKKNVMKIERSKELNNKSHAVENEMKFKVMRRMISTFQDLIKKLINDTTLTQYKCNQPTLQLYKNILQTFENNDTQRRKKLLLRCNPRFYKPIQKITNTLFQISEKK